MTPSDLSALDEHPALAPSKPFFQQLSTAFPDSQATLHEVLADGDWVVVRLTASGTHQGEWMGTPPTGRHAAWEVIAMYQIVDGKIVRQHSQADVVSQMRQLGAMPEDTAG